MADSGFSFGGMTIPVDTKRLYVTAMLVPSTDDPRIQPTGFPDIGPVFYPDPSGEHGQICLIESEASMANRLEDVCVADKYTGTLLPCRGARAAARATHSIPGGFIIQNCRSRSRLGRFGRSRRLWVLPRQRRHRVAFRERRLHWYGRRLGFEGEIQAARLAERIQ
jgi:hypothetical protein